MTRRRWLSAALALIAALLAALPALAQPVAGDALKALHWRFIGPLGNRVITVAGVPARPLG